MGFATGFEGFVALLGWCRLDHEEGTVEVETRWFQWGYFTARGQETGWYILIRLPSYLMQIPWHLDQSCGEPKWHQRCLLFKEKLPAGDCGWEMIEIACEPSFTPTSR